MAQFLRPTRRLFSHRFAPLYARPNRDKLLDFFYQELKPIYFRMRDDQA